MSTKKTQTYSEHYAALEAIALESGEGLESNDIDQLIEKMGDATKHYKALKSRIEEVEKILGLDGAA
jgi:hypothetical protein